MNMTLIVNVFLIALTLFFAFRILKLSGRTKENQKMLKILDSFDDRDVFFESAEDFIATEKNQEFVNKVSVLRLWGDAYYERDEDYKRHLAELNIDGLLDPDGKKNGYSQNEDSFFYLYMAIPNRLNYRKAEGFRKLLHEKLSAYDEANAQVLLKKIYEENKKYYDNTDDRGRTFIESFLEGEYGGYKYSKQLIGLYKSCEEALLAKMYEEENNTERCEECMKEIETFGTKTRLGIRWMKEVGLSYPEEPEEEEESEEAEEETEETENTAETETEETTEEKETEE